MSTEFHVGDLVERVGTVSYGIGSSGDIFTVESVTHYPGTNSGCDLLVLKGDSCPDGWYFYARDFKLYSPSNEGALNLTAAQRVYLVELLERERERNEDMIEKILDTLST